MEFNTKEVLCVCYKSLVHHKLETLYLNEVLDDSQELAFWYFYDPDKTVKFHVRSKWSSYNDLVVVYDMVNKTFHVDTNKKFWSYCVLNWKY